MVSDSYIPKIQRGLYFLREFVTPLNIKEQKSGNSPERHCCNLQERHQRKNVQSPIHVSFWEICQEGVCDQRQGDKSVPRGGPGEAVTGASILSILLPVYLARKPGSSPRSWSHCSTKHTPGFLKCKLVVSSLRCLKNLSEARTTSASLCDGGAGRRGG